MFCKDRVDYRDKEAANKLAEWIRPYLIGKTLIFCVGTDKCIGDCLGPLVGTMLKKNNFPYPVIGTLEAPAHATNIEAKILQVKAEYPDYFIIAIDACLGYKPFIGNIEVSFRPVHPGKGAGKNLPPIGDLSITGVVDTVEYADIFSTRAIRLSFIMSIAETIATGLIKAAQRKPRVEKVGWYNRALTAFRQVAATREG